MTQGRLLLLLTAASLALAGVSLAVGPSGVSLTTAVSDLWNHHDTTAVVILADIRLPRALLGLLTGATLGLSGAALQGLLRNPLAEPGVIGISASAALGAVLVFYTGLAAAADWALPAGGMIGAALAVAGLYALSGRQAGTLTLILAGIAIGALANAVISLALSLSPNPFALSEIVFWLLGSLADRSLGQVALTAPFMLAGWMLLLPTGRGLEALALGEDTARSLGVNLERLRLQVIAGTALCVGASVAVCGAIGFVGLVVPHLLRPLVGHNPGRLLTASALGGAVLTLAADIVVRILPTGGQELKLGVVTALIGAPFFLALVLRSRREVV